MKHLVEIKNEDGSKNCYDAILENISGDTYLKCAVYNYPAGKTYHVTAFSFYAKTWEEVEQTWGKDVREQLEELAF